MDALSQMLVLAQVTLLFIVVAQVIAIMPTEIYQSKTTSFLLHCGVIL